MKRLLISSGILLLGLIIMIVLNVLSFNNSNNNIFKQGNALYQEEKFQEALDIYKNALVDFPEDKRIIYNFAQVSYKLKNYGDAIENYNKTPDNIDKYLCLGNSIFNQGELSNDPKEKIKLLQESLDKFKEGIILFPEDINLKFNYEFVQKRIEDMKNNNDQNKSDNKEDNPEKSDKNQSKDNKGEENSQDNKDESSKENQDNSSSESKDNSSKDNKDNSSKDNKDTSSSENKDTSSKENEDTTTSKNDDKSSKENQDTTSSKNDDNSSKDNKDATTKSTDSNSKPTNNEKETETESGASTSDNQLSDETKSKALEVLEMLELQEKESLKNNQAIKKSQVEGDNDW